ncbi:MAG: hypothetical protein SFV81_29010 [Pirellulaceae bacterium]|nr:hypothetical protein [Pirellulaceae bacterium]
MSNCKRLRRRFLAVCVCTAAVSLPQTGFSQELRSLLFDDPISLSPNMIEKEASLELGTTSQPKSPRVTPEIETETIRERFKDGKVHIERQVTLDGDQNYVNHGNFTEWSSKGDIVTSGSYEMGKRQGAWIKFYQSKDAALFGTQPYTRFKAPFQSSVEFKDDKMDGLWSITDADHRVVSHIELLGGIRNGKCTWFHPNGQVLYQADYKDGILDGLYLEKTAEGKVVRQDTYVDGRRAETNKEYYPSKALKSEVSYLSPPQIIVTKDEWDTAKLATYSSTGEKEKHGGYRTYFDNGQLSTVGTYEHGVLTGSFESWHANGEKAASGSYIAGFQDGNWNWWHENGMRKATATYKQGRAEGEVLAWSDSGKRIVSPKPESSSDEKVQAEFTATRIVPANIPKLR